jgi:hypothetical protein
MIFYRDQFAEINLTIRSDEPLGILDADYLENETGIDGYLTLIHVSSSQCWEIPMVTQPLETPSVPHDVFTGFQSTATLPNGVFEIRGRVRDIAGNYTILSSISNPNGNERIMPLRFEIRAGNGGQLTLGVLVIKGVLVLPRLKVLPNLEPLTFNSGWLARVSVDTDLPRICVAVPDRLPEVVVSTGV